MRAYVAPVALVIVAAAAFQFGRPRHDTGTTLVAPPRMHCLGLRKVTQFHLDVYSGYREKFNDPQGLFCVKLASEDNPDNPRDDDELTVFGLNSGNNTIIYNTSLVSIRIVGGAGADTMRFRNPLALAGDAAGNLYVADSGNDRIAHLRYDRGALRWVGQIRGPADGPLRKPSGVALGGGALYVADTGNDRVAVFGPDGSFLKSLGAAWGGAPLVAPFSLAAAGEGDEWLYYGDYFLAVTDSFGQRLWKLSHDGTPLGLVRRSSIGGRGSFGHVAIDYYGSIYVTDAVEGRIHKFNRHLNHLVAYGDRQRGEAELDEPRGIACYRRFGQIFVSERAGARYFWIGTDILRFGAENLAFDIAGARCAVEISFLLTEYSEISLVLRDEGGKDRFTIISDYLMPPGLFNRRIEVTCPDAGALAKCNLRIVIIAKPTYSSREYITVERESRSLTPIITGNSSSQRP